MKLVHLLFCLSLFLLLIFVQPADCQIAKLINYQGQLTDNVGDPVNATLSMTFKIYATAGAPAHLWTETHPAVIVTDGLFNVLLGSVAAIGDDLFDDDERWLGITVAPDPEIIPRTRLSSLGYAFHSLKADYAQTGGGWVDDGTAIRLETGTDNVGIGTTTPTAKLHVNGTMRLDDVTTIAIGDRIQAEENGGVRILGEQGDTPATPAIGFFSTNGVDDGAGGNGIYRPSANAMCFATSGLERLRIAANGMIGIGTNAPPVVGLHIKGSGFTGHTGILLENTEVTQNWDFALGNNADGFQITEWGVSPRITVKPTTGYVGIGTSNPSVDLDVNGDANVSGSLTVNGVSMGRIYITSNGTVLTTRSGGYELYWDETAGELQLTNSSGDWLDFWWQSQKGGTTNGSSGAKANGTSFVPIITNTNNSDYGFEIHFGQADGTNGWCSVWLQYANGVMVGHYIKY